MFKSASVRSSRVDSYKNIFFYIIFYWQYFAYVYILMPVFSFFINSYDMVVVGHLGLGD